MYNIKQYAAAGLALAACAAAHGQTNQSAPSSINLYGLLDLNLGVVSEAGPGHGSVLRLGSGGMNTSRIGLRGGEDLGAGLKAVYQFEAGFAADTGVPDNPLFKRQANVGLEGAFGRVVAGRSFSTVYDFMVSYDPMGFAPGYSWGPTGGAGGASTYGMTVGIDNLIKYSGTFGGLEVGASYGAGEQSGSTSEGAKGEVALDYTRGPLSLVATWERSNGNRIAATGSHTVTTAWHVGAMLKSGRWKLQAVARDYRQTAATALTPDLRGTLYWGGASYLIAPALTLTGVVYLQDVKKTAANPDPALYIGRLRYALSRRTDLYLTAAWAHAAAGNVVSLSRSEAGFGNTQRSVLAGIQHRF